MKALKAWSRTKGARSGMPLPRRSESQRPSRSQHFNWSARALATSRQGHAASTAPASKGTARRLLHAATLCAGLVVLLTGCATRSTVVSESTLQSGAVDNTVYTRDELYFGMNIPTGGVVSDSAFTVFLDREVAPRLPDGFTVFEATGHWRDTATGRMIREPSRVLLVYYRENQPQTGRALSEIAALYKRLFQQQAVLRVTARVRASF